VFVWLPLRLADLDWLRSLIALGLLRAIRVVGMCGVRLVGRSGSRLVVEWRWVVEVSGWTTISNGYSCS